MKICNGNFNIDDHLKIINKLKPEAWEFSERQLDSIKEIILYFNCIETEKNYDLNKGLMITGPYGCGKTTIIQIISKYLYYIGNKLRFTIQPSRLILREFSLYGYAGLEKYSFNKTIGEHNSTVSNPYHLCIDDLGTEESGSNNYGNKADVLSELLLDRYELMMSKGILTHVITNLGITELKKIYSGRIIDRFKEMYNILILSEESKRK